MDVGTLIINLSGSEFGLNRKILKHRKIMMEWTYYDKEKNDLQILVTRIERIKWDIIWFFMDFSLDVK